MRDETVDRRKSASEWQTVRKDLLAQLQRMASVGAVASSVAHEFNNILTAILNQANLGNRAADLEAKQKAFEKILASARRAAKITTGVLALSRNRTARKEPADVVALVEEVLAVVEKDLTKHRVRVERDFRPVPRITAVPIQIEQVLMNLIINARQAMPEGGPLRITIQQSRETGMVEISIRDSGMGISPENLGKIFEPFFTTKEGPDETGQGGSGLGLSICREIIERHQGRIRVESLVGRGTTFTIKLPPLNGIQPASAA